MTEDKARHTVNELIAQADSENTAYLKFLDEASLSSGLYTLRKGQKDPQSPHLLDELYYVLEGQAKLQVSDKVYPALPGDVLFVPAHVEHKFIEIEEDLRLLVFFSKVPITRE